jgi:hypothetical protein
MSPYEHLSVGEFSRAMESLERNVIGRLDQRCDRIEDRMSIHAERLVKLETARKKSNLRTAGWASGAATVLVAIIETVKTYIAR